MVEVTSENKKIHTPLPYSPPLKAGVFVLAQTATQYCMEGVG